MAKSSFSSIKYLGKLLFDFKAKNKSKEQLKKAIITKSIMLVLTIVGLVVGLKVQISQEILRMFIIGWWIIPILFKLLYAALVTGKKEIDNNNVVTVDFDKGSVSTRPSIVGFIVLFILIIGAIFLFAFASVVLTIIYIPLLIAQLIVHINAYVKANKKAD